MAAPSSFPLSKFRTKASRTGSNPGRTKPEMSVLMEPTSRSGNGGPDEIRHGGVERVRLVDEDLVPGALEPDELLRGRGQRIEIGHARLGRDPVVLPAEKEEDGHLQRGRELLDVQARGLGVHGPEREPEAAQ